MPPPSKHRPRITVNRVLRCSDFITYPYFTTDYRVGRYASGQIVEEGITNWDAGRMRFFQMTWFDNGRRAYQSNSIFEVWWWYGGGGMWLFAVYGYLLYVCYCHSM